MGMHYTRLCVDCSYYLVVLQRAMSEVTPMSELRRRLKGKTQTALAEELGISIGHLNDILCGRRAIGPVVLKALGLERVTVFKSVKRDQTAV